MRFVAGKVARREAHRGSKIEKAKSGKQNEKAKSGSRRGDYFKKLLPFEIFILNCRLEFSKNLKRCRVFHTFIVL